MKKSYQELQQEYAKLKQEEKAKMADLNEWLKTHTSQRLTPPQRNTIVLCSRNMAFLYLSACLSLKDETFREKFKIHLYIVEAYAKQIFQNQDSVYLFLQVALCDIAFSAQPYIKLFMPDFIIETTTNETRAFINYVMKISHRLLQTDYQWYGKALIESVLNTLQAEKYFLPSHQEKAIQALTQELQKYPTK